MLSLLIKLLSIYLPQIVAPPSVLGAKRNWKLFGKLPVSIDDQTQKRKECTC